MIIGIKIKQQKSISKTEDVALDKLHLKYFNEANLNFKTINLFLNKKLSQSCVIETDGKNIVGEKITIPINKKIMTDFFKTNKISEQKLVKLSIKKTTLKNFEVICLCDMILYKNIADKEITLEEY